MTCYEHNQTEDESYYAPTIAREEGVFDRSIFFPWMRSIHSQINHEPKKCNVSRYRFILSNITSSMDQWIQQTESEFQSTFHHYHQHNRAYFVPFVCSIFMTILSCTIFAYVMTSIERQRSNQQFQDWYHKSSDRNDRHHDDTNHDITTTTTIGQVSLFHS